MSPTRPEFAWQVLLALRAAGARNTAYDAKTYAIGFTVPDTPGRGLVELDGAFAACAGIEPAERRGRVAGLAGLAVDAARSGHRPPTDHRPPTAHAAAGGGDSAGMTSLGDAYLARAERLRAAGDHIAAEVALVAAEECYAAASAGPDPRRDPARRAGRRW